LYKRPSIKIIPVVKYVIPESPIFAWPRGQVDSWSWDAALDVVQQSLLGMAVANNVNDEEDRVLTEVFKQCQELRAKKYLKVVTTNHELAKKYAISPRTVTNWRKEGCPFEEGQWAVLDWLARRRYAPVGANAKFAKQLRERKERTRWAEIMGKIHQGVAEMRQLKAAYQAQGLEVPEDLRGFRASR
jgi:hypothetical protein